MRLASGIRVLKQSFGRRGFRGTLRLILKRLSPASRRAVRAERAFDAEYGIDTAGSVSLAALDVSGSSWRLGRGYQGSNPEEFRKQLGTLQIDHRDFVFIDIGSGKGRALLLASKFPFKRILGVEISAELNAVARRNIERYVGGEQQCEAIEVVTADATVFELPEEPLVLYFYTPFDDITLMRQVMKNARRSLEAHPRLTYVVYAGDPMLVPAIEEVGFTRIETLTGPEFARTNTHATFLWDGAKPSITS